MKTEPVSDVTAVCNPQSPVARSKISNAKWVGCQWPKKYVETQMQICNDQTVVQSGGLDHTAEEETSNEVKFSLSHFSKHFVESETTEESVDSISDNNLSEDSLRHLVFADYQGREVWNHSNQKSFLEFETGVIQEMSKYLPERTKLMVLIKLWRQFAGTRITVTGKGAATHSTSTLHQSHSCQGNVFLVV